MKMVYILKGMRMKTILVLANNSGGLYKFRKELIIELLNFNRVYISVPDGDFIKPLTELGCKIINTDVDRRGINPFRDFKLFNRYRKMINELNVDMIITYTIKPNIYGNLIARTKKIDYYANITGLGTLFQKENFIKKMAVILYKMALKNAKTVFFENKGNSKYFIKNKIIREDQAHVLNGAGVNLDEFTYHEYPLENSSIKFLFIGRIMREKGFDEFLFSATNLKIEFPTIEFDIVGTLEDDYANAISNCNLRYHGYQRNVIRYMKNAHCIVLPSYHEGMANTNLEAASIGRPLITSKIHGCEEAVIDGITGYLCKSRDKEDLYKKMRDFILLNYDEKRLMGIRARTHMEINFNKNNIIESTLSEIFKNIKKEM